MIKNPKKMKTFHGERITWYSPSTLEELLELKSKFPKAPLVVGNTNVGKQNVGGHDATILQMKNV